MRYGWLGDNRGDHRTRLRDSRRTAGRQWVLAFDNNFEIAIHRNLQLAMADIVSGAFPQC